MNDDFFSGLSLAEQEQAFMQEEIISGKYGQPGDIFLTTRSLAEKRRVSLVTAHNILKGLSDSGFIELRGKRYYLSESAMLHQHLDTLKAIGLIVPQINNEFYASLTDAVVNAARANSMNVLIMTTSYDPGQERQALQTLLDHRVSGLISCIPACPENEDTYRQYSIPCVMLAHSIDKLRISSVQVNSFSISQKVAQHLIEEGYKKFIYIGTQKITLENDVRFAAFQMDIKREGFSLDNDDIIRFSDDVAANEALLSNRLSSISEPVGIFCYHDLIAATVYKVCNKMDRIIPGDVGVIGFDDLSIASSLYPPLTSVQYRVTTMAETALNLLLAKLKSPTAPYDNYYIEPNLVIRKSANLSKSKSAVTNSAGT